MRRSGFFLSLAAGLVASLALSAPTQAGTIFDVEAEVIVAKGTATSVIVDFSPGPITGPITILSSCFLDLPYWSRKLLRRYASRNFWYFQLHDCVPS
jgi:hypothetical protein